LPDARISARLELEGKSPENTKTRLEGGPVSPASGGTIKCVATLIVPQNQFRRKSLREGQRRRFAEPAATGGFSEGEPVLAEQIAEQISAARAGARLDELSRTLWRAHSEGLLADADAQGLSEALQARRGALVGQPPPRKAVPAAGPRRRRPGRPKEKLFGLGRPIPLDLEAKVRVMHLIRCLLRRTEKGKAYGAITAKAEAVARALLWAFHNAKSGLCFPSYEAIAEAAGCARSTVAEAIKALEDAGVLTWVQRVRRVREPCADLFGRGGWRWRVVRTSNAYSFVDPSKSEKPSGTADQAIPCAVSAPRRPMNTRLEASIGRPQEPPRGPVAIVGA
jgi:Helix-turn-helix domain